MNPTEEVDYILHDCLFAVGQGIGLSNTIDAAALAWLRARYRDTFVHVMTHNGNSWAHDRRRVTAVSRYLGQRAAHHAGGGGRIDVQCVARAAAEVENGCRMSAERDSSLPTVSVAPHVNESPAVRDRGPRRYCREHPNQHR